MEANLAYERLAAELNAKIAGSGKALEVTERMVRDAAERMSIRGYRHTSASIGAVKAYLSGYGLLLSGDVGTGKTLFFEVLNARPMRKISLLRMAADKLEEIRDEVRALAGEEIVIDDIGNEPIYNNYGCKMDLLPWILEERIGSRKRTHFTTNLGSDKLLARYGARGVDRLSEMTKGFRFSGTSMRKAKVNADVIEQVTREYDWGLCAERCGNCTGRGCAQGFNVPPDRNERPFPPEECVGFTAKAGNKETTGETER